MTNTAKWLLLLVAVLLQPGCVATRAPHEPYRPPIIEPLIYQPEPGAIYTASADERLWEDRTASPAGPRDEHSAPGNTRCVPGVVSPEFFSGDLVAAVDMVAGNEVRTPRSVEIMNGELMLPSISTIGIADGLATN